MTDEQEKCKALNTYLVNDGDFVSEHLYGDVFETSEGKEYVVLTDSEADDLCREQILDTLWAFNKSFLDSHSEAIADLDDDTWRAITDQCESANPLVKRLIDDLDHFIDVAICADGRGHFINSYDGEEIELGYCAEFVAYRQN